jgi:hypothetical protein
MKRAGGLYRQIPTYENLCLAFWKACRGKQDRKEVIAFGSNFDGQVRKTFALQEPSSLLGAP